MNFMTITFKKQEPELQKNIKEIISEPNKLTSSTFSTQIEDLLIDREKQVSLFNLQ